VKSVKVALAMHWQPAWSDDLKRFNWVADWDGIPHYPSRPRGPTAEDDERVMRVFIFTTLFAPSIGGIERLMEVLATQFAQLGHEVVLATLTPGREDGFGGVRLVRQPSTRQFLSFLRWCDVHLQANLSLKQLHPLLLRRPFVVAHGNDYQRRDGRRGLRDHLKLASARRAYGIACSRYIAQRVPCREVIGNAYDDATFRTEIPLASRPKDIVFVGRLVSDKGCDTLLAALATLAREGLKPSCTVVGDGPERERLKEMAAAVDLPIAFLGSLPPPAVAEQLNQHRIQVVPSRFAEPFGIVALEGLACGCLPIVAATGGLVDAIGHHGLTFTNGDPVQLANRLRAALGDFDRAQQSLQGLERHLAGFTARQVAKKYLQAFERARGEAA
jgi:glycogen synthase